MILECSAFTLNRYVVIGFKPITVIKGCVPSDLRCEMIVMFFDWVSGRAIDGKNMYSQHI